MSQVHIDLGEKISGKFLTFKLDNEEFGFEILKVQEIIKMQHITPIPQTPDYIMGVINLRGKVIPVIDLRLKFCMPSVDATDNTCVIVVQVVRSKETLVMGVIVDQVSEVQDIPAEAIDPAPKFDQSCRHDYILGMAKSNSSVKILLDIDKVLSADDLEMLDCAIKQ
jgi:purine-binding chemotaxis protein CheW